MSKFKDGDLAWSHKCGFMKVKVNEFNTFSIIHDRDSYTNDGKLCEYHKYPSLLTVEEAAKLGYFPPKEKKKIWVNVYDHTSYCYYTEEEAKAGAGENCLHEAVPFTSDVEL